MSKHGLTRVTFIGDRAIVVAGPVPEAIAAEAVKLEPEPSALTRTPFPKTPNKPPRFVAKPQANVKESIENVR